MRIIKGKFNEYGWRTIIKTRESVKERNLIIERKSNKHSENNHDVYLEGEDIDMLFKFLKELKKSR